MTVTIRVNVSDTLKNLTALEQKQLPFALSLALNNVAIDAQLALRDHFSEVFTIRRPSFVLKQGAKIFKFSSKRDLSVVMGVDDKADFLTKFERGDVKKPTQASSLAIPVDVRRNKRDLITRGNRPRQLLDRLGQKRGAGGVFRLTHREGKLVPGIYQRTGRGGRGGVKLLFASTPKAQTPPVLKFAFVIGKTVEKKFQLNFDKAMARALATSVEAPRIA